MFNARPALTKNMKHLAEILKDLKDKDVARPIRKDVARPIRKDVARPEPYIIQTQNKHTNKHTCVCDFSQRYGMKAAQIDYILQKTGAGPEELEKALKILKKSHVKNIMKMLLTASFYQGECILEEDIEEIDPESVQVRNLYTYYERENQKRKKKIAQAFKSYEKGKAALKWFQSLSGEERARVKQVLLLDHTPWIIERDFDRGKFSPATVAFLVKEYEKTPV